MLHEEKAHQRSNEFLPSAHSWFLFFSDWCSILLFFFGKKRLFIYPPQKIKRFYPSFQKRTEILCFLILAIQEFFHRIKYGSVLSACDSDSALSIFRILPLSSLSVYLIVLSLLCLFWMLEDRDGDFAFCHAMGKRGKSVSCRCVSLFAFFICCFDTRISYFIICYSFLFRN